MKKLLFLFLYMWTAYAAEVHEIEVCPICNEAYAACCEPHQVACCNQKFCIICLGKMRSYGQFNCPFCRQSFKHTECVQPIDRNDDDNEWTELVSYSIIQFRPLGNQLQAIQPSTIPNQLSDYIQCPVCHQGIHFYNFKAHQLHCD